MSEDFQTEVADDTEVIYQGNCKIGKYSRTNAGTQTFTLKDFDDVEQFKYILNHVDPNTPVNIIGGVGDDLYFNNWHLQLKKAGDGVRTGAHLDLMFHELDDESYETIRSLKDSDAELSIVIVKGEFAIKEKPKKGAHGKFAAKIMRSKLMLMPEFWALVGTEDDYEKWLQKQPCCVTGKFHKDETTGEQRCEVAHVRSVNWGAGIAKKPPYYAIPLVHKVHQAQHEKTMLYVWDKYVGRQLPPTSHVRFPINDELEIVKSWFAYKAQSYVKQWIKYKIKQSLNVESLSFVSEEMFKNYLTNISAYDMIRFL